MCYGFASQIRWLCNLQSHNLHYQDGTKAHTLLFSAYKDSTPCALWPCAFCARIRQRRFAVAWRLPGQQQEHSLPAAGAAAGAVADAVEAAAAGEAAEVGDAAWEHDGSSRPCLVAGAAVAGVGA